MKRQKNKERESTLLSQVEDAATERRGRLLRFLGIIAAVGAIVVPFVASIL